MEVQYQTTVVELSFWPDVPCFEWRAFGPMTSREFRESNERITDMAAEYRKTNPALTGLLLDTCLLGPVSEEDLAWAANVEDPRRLSVGLSRQAFVMPLDVFGQLSVDDYLSISADGKLEKAMFGSRDDAMAWLASAPIAKP